MGSPKESYLVIGGCGFLGRHIVERLVARGDAAVAVFDLVQRHHDKNIQFFTGDLCELEDLSNAIRQVSQLSSFSPVAWTIRPGWLIVPLLRRRAELLPYFTLPLQCTERIIQTSVGESM